MALRGQVVHLVGLYLLQDADQPERFVEVAVVQRDPVGVRRLVQVVDAVPLQLARSAHEAVDFVALLEQQFGQVRPVLSGDSGDECGGHVALVLSIGMAFAVSGLWCDPAGS